jgi:hypothetical protein
VTQTNEAYNRIDMNQTKYELAMKLFFPYQFAICGASMREFVCERTHVLAIEAV